MNDRKKARVFVRSIEENPELTEEQEQYLEQIRIYNERKKNLAAKAHTVLLGDPPEEPS